jgi:hypothetical protein
MSKCILWIYKEASIEGYPSKSFRGKAVQRELSMKNSRQTLGLRKLLSLAASPNALSWPVVFTGTALSILLHFAPSGNTVHGNIWIRIVMAIFGYLPSIAFVALVLRLLQNFQSQTIKITLVLVSYLVGGALRGVFFSLVFFHLGMSNSLNLTFRIFGSAIPFGFATALATISVGALHESRQRIGLLLTKQEELRSALDELGRTRSTFENRVSLEIENRVDTEVNQLVGKPEQAMLLELKALLGDFVRPLSHALASEVPDWKPIPVVEAKVGWRAIVDKLKPELALQPFLLTSLSTITAAVAFVNFFGLQRAVVMELISIVLLTSLSTFFNRLLKRIPTNFSTLFKSVITTSTLFITGAATGVIVDFYANDKINPHFAYEASLIVVPTFGWIILLGSAANASSRDLEVQLNHTLAQLRWARARINLVNWFEHGELSRLLHGEIQSALHFGILKFEANKAKRDQTIREMQDRIHQAFLQQAAPLELKKQLLELADFWQEICTIRTPSNLEVFVDIQNDKVGKSVIWEVISESCVNAIRHGEAKNIDIQVALETDSIFKILVINDGALPNKMDVVGLGTNILNSCTINWSRRIEDNRFVLEAFIPVKGMTPSS